MEGSVQMFKRLWTDAFARKKTERALVEHYSLIKGSPPGQNWELLFVQEYFSKMVSNAL